MSMMSSEELAAMEQQINPGKPNAKGIAKPMSFRDKVKLTNRLKFLKSHPPPFFSRRKALTNDTYRKMAATSAVAAAYTDADLRQHMIAAGLPDYPDPATNAVARQLARTRVEADLMDRTYPREAAYLTAIGTAFPENMPQEDRFAASPPQVDRLLITSDDGSSSDDDAEWPDDIGADAAELSSFEMAVGEHIQTICDAKEAAVLDSETREMMAYASADPASQEAALLEALRRDKDREAAHVAADSEAAAVKLEGVFKDSLPENLKGDLEGAAADALHVALVDELNRASLAEIKRELTSDADRAAADAADTKVAYMVAVLEDQKPVDDEMAMQRKSRRLKAAYTKLRNYVSKFGSAKQARLTELFGRMGRFVRAIPQQARSRPFMRHYLGAMAVAASLSTADLQAYDTAGVLDAHPEHPYAQQLMRQRIAADLMAMADVHGARYMADLAAHTHEEARAAIGACLMEIGIAPSDLQAVKLRPVTPATPSKVAAGDDMQSALSRGLARMRGAVAPEEVAGGESDAAWEVTAPEPQSANATVVPIAPPAMVATVVAREQQATADVPVVAKEAETVISSVEQAASSAAVATTQATMASVPPADAAAVPDSVLLAYIATTKKIIEKEELDKLKATIKDAAQRKANEELQAQVASLTRLLAAKAAAPAAPGAPVVTVPSAPGAPASATAATTAVPQVISLPTDAAAAIADTREERVDKVEEEIERASSTKSGAAMSFFRDIMGSTSRGSAGFLKEILPTLGTTVSQSASEVLPGVTSAGIESLGNVGLAAATTYADRRAARKASAAEPISLPDNGGGSGGSSSAERQQRREERQVNREKRAAEKQERREARQKGREQRAAEKQARHEERETRRAARKEGREKREADAAATKRREERQARRDARQVRRDEKSANAAAKAQRKADRAARREAKQKSKASASPTAPSETPEAKAERRAARAQRKAARAQRRQTKAAGGTSSNKAAKGTYATRAEKRAAMDAKREAKYGKASPKQIQKREARRAARDQARATRKANKSSSSKPKKTKTRASRTPRTGVMPKGASMACTDCGASGDAVTPIGCASCGAIFDADGNSLSSGVSDTSSLTDLDMDIGGAFLGGDDSWGTTSFTSTSSYSSSVSDDSSDTSDDGSIIGAKRRRHHKKRDGDTCVVRDPEDEAYECKSCGVRSKAYCSGKFCKVCRGRTDGCDRCAKCDDTGCAACFATSPAARLAAYRRARGLTKPVAAAAATAPIDAKAPECLSCGAIGVDLAAGTVCRQCSRRTDGGAPCAACKNIGCATCRAAAPRRIDNHLCYGETCGVCELRRKYGKGRKNDSGKAPIGENISVVVADNSAVVDPLGGDGIEAPLFALNAWGLFMLVRSTYPILQQNVEGDWQFPPAVSAVRVLAVLQRSPRGAEHALMVMDRLCLFLQFAPRMTPALAPGAVELAHRLAEARVPGSMPLLDTPFTQDEIDWVLAGTGISFGALPEPQLWTFVYETLVGLRATYDKAAVMYNTILSYSPLMSMVEAKKFRDANVSRDAYAAISAALTKS